MIKISEQSNSNYLAKIVEIKNIKKHPNADRLQVVTVDFQNVITGLDAKEGDLYVFFPLESQLNKDFLSQTNSYRKAEMNVDKEKVGFFESNGRVRAVKLRGEKSMGYIVQTVMFNEFFNSNIPWGDHINKEFDTINDILMVKKYVVKTREKGIEQKGKKPRVSRLIDGQVHLHIETENLRKEAYKIKPNDEINISYKMHGTSGWISNILVKRRLNIFEKVLKFIGIKIKDTEYDYVYGSRKVVKNSDLKDPKRKDHFYGYDLWKSAGDELKEFIPKGFSLYYELVGYTKNGAAIQKNYDYGCQEGQSKIFIYRITFTNEDGIVNNLSTKEMHEFCDRFGLKYVYSFYTGKARDIFLIKDDENWTEHFIKALEQDYNEKDCFICKNKVPEEGIVLRKESMFEFEAYKLKSFRYLTYETELLDKGESNLEDDQ